MDLNVLKSMLPDMGRSPVARSTGLLLHNLSAAAVKMNTYEFVSHISSDGLLYDDPELGADIRVLLSSKFDAERAEGLKRLLALFSSGADVAPFFSDVIKIVVTQSLPVKRMAYTFLAHYSSRRPDEALMVINTLQKELGHPSPITRAHGMRAMAAMRLRAAAPVVLLAIRRTSRDPSPLVRRTAALALAAVHTLTAPPVAPIPIPPSTQDRATSPLPPASRRSSGAPGGGPDEEVLELLDGLLGDADPSVAGAAACTFVCICPWRLEPVGERFRSLCHALQTLDEWGQAAVLELLLRYGVARFGSADRAHWASAAPEHRGDPSVSAAGADSRAGARPSGHTGQGEARMATARASLAVGGPQQRPEDLQLVLRSTRPLLQSQCAGVVLGAAALHWELNSEEQEVDAHVVPALLFLLRSAPHCQQVVLTCVSSMAAACPGLFERRVLDLLVYPGDSHQIQAHKLSLLVALARDDTVDAVMRELEDYVQDLDPWFAVHAIRAAGACAMRIPRARPSTVRGLLHLLALHCSAAPSPSPAPEAMAGTGESGGAPQARRDTGGDPQGWQGEPKAAAAVGSGPPVSTPTGAPEAHAAAPSTGSADGARGVPERGEGGESETGTSSAPAMRPGEERGAAGGWGGDRGAREQAEGTAAVVVEALGALRHLVEVSPQHSAEVMQLLLPRLGSIQPLRAQATAVWMLGHAARASPLLLRAAPCALHPLVARFPALPSAALQLQLLTTVAQVFLMLGEAAASGEQSRLSGASNVLEEEPTPAAASALSLALLGSVLAAAAVDSCIDVRDRALFLRQLLARDGFISTPSQPQSQSPPQSQPKSPSESHQEQPQQQQEQHRQGPSTNDQSRWTSSLSWHTIVCEPPATAAARRESGVNGGNEAQQEAGEERGKGNGNGGAGGAVTGATQGGLAHPGAQRGRFFLSSLSHCVNHLAPSYTPLPPPRSLQSGEREGESQRGELVGGVGDPGAPLPSTGACGTPLPARSGYPEGSSGSADRSSWSAKESSAGASLGSGGQGGRGSVAGAPSTAADGRGSSSTQDMEAVIPQSDLESWLGSS